MVSLRLVEEDAFSNVHNSVWLRPENPSRESDTIACSSFDLGFPEIRVASFSQTEGNGSVDMTRFHGSSTVSVDLTLLGPDKVPVFEQLRSMCLPYKRLYLYVNRPEWSGERRMRLRANSFSFVSERTSAARWKVALSWANPSGRMEAATSSAVSFDFRTSDPVPEVPPEPILDVGSGYGSLQYGAVLYGSRPAPVGAMRTLDGPVTLGEPDVATLGYGRESYSSKMYGSDQGQDEAISRLLVGGTAPVLPQIKIYGPCKSPQLTFNNIGTTIYLRNLEILNGDYLLIDVPSKQMIINADLNRSVYPYLSLAESDGWNGWPYLLGGLNDIVFFAETKGTGSHVEILWRDEWI